MNRNGNEISHLPVQLAQIFLYYMHVVVKSTLNVSTLFIFSLLQYFTPACMHIPIHVQAFRCVEKLYITEEEKGIDNFVVVA